MSMRMANSVEIGYPKGMAEKDMKGMNTACTTAVVIKGTVTARDMNWRFASRSGLHGGEWAVPAPGDGQDACE